jgi:acid stress-induced BolA-like protein IbaG/YrbA
MAAKAEEARASMMAPEAVRELILEGFPGAEVSVRDLTGGLDHFQVTIVHEAFSGKGLLEQHKLVQDHMRVAIEDGRIHALSLRTYSPEEWRKRAEKRRQ